MLFVQNLPLHFDQDLFNDIFGQFKGFREARPVKERGLAFVEFDTPEQAQFAKNEIQSKNMMAKF